MREGGHRKARMGDAETAFLVCQHSGGCFDRLAFALGAGECPSLFETVLQNQPMNIAHMCIQRTITRKSKWDSTDAS
jgi:hypothetical protein